jgi:hypothetical protein
VSRVATEGSLRSRSIGREEHALVLDRPGLADDVVHERRVGQRPVANAATGDQVIHRQRAGDIAGTVCPGRAAAERGDANHALDAVPRERLSGGPREADERSFNRRRLRVGRRQPENGVGVGECLVDDRRVAVRALDNVEALADVGRESRRIPGDGAELFAAVEQVVAHLVADEAAGSGDDDHRVAFRLW